MHTLERNAAASFPRRRVALGRALNGGNFPTLILSHDGRWNARNSAADGFNLTRRSRNDINRMGSGLLAQLSYYARAFSADATAEAARGSAIMPMWLTPGITVTGTSGLTA